MYSPRALDHYPNLNYGNDTLMKHIYLIYLCYESLIMKYYYKYSIRHKYSYRQYHTIAVKNRISYGSLIIKW